jgi:AAA domain
VRSIRHLERGRVRLALVGGLPGTGKTTLAGALADATGWSLLCSDEVRRDLGRNASPAAYGAAAAGWVYYVVEAGAAIPALVVFGCILLALLVVLVPFALTAPTSEGRRTARG